jgi:hypothetical protein
VIPYYIVTLYDQLYPEVYVYPDVLQLKNSLQGFCNIVEELNYLYRQDSLNYIQVTGSVTVDIAEQYLFNINNAWKSYLSFLHKNTTISLEASIVNLENRLNNSIILTRIYYGIYANTSQPSDAFNYQIRFSNFTIKSAPSLPSIVGRQIVTFNNNELIRRAKVNDLNLVINWLPQLALIGKINYKQKLRFSQALSNFWLKSRPFYFHFYFSLK